MTDIVTTRLRLTRFTLDDAPFILRLLNEPSFIDNIADKGVRDLEGARSYLRSGPLAMYAQHGIGLLRVARIGDDLPIGMCGLLRRDTLEEFDLGYAFLPEHWGSGYAREAASATLDFGRERLGLQRVVAIVNAGNERSIHLLEKLGFAFERNVPLSPAEPSVPLYAVTL